MILGRGQFLHLVEEVVDPRLAEKRQPPVIVDPLEMKERLLLLAHVEFTTIELLEEILIGQVAALGRQLPAIGQEMSVPEPEAAASILRHFDVLAGPTEAVFSMIVDGISENRAEVVLPFIGDLGPAPQTAVAVVIQGQRAIRPLRLCQTKDPTQEPARLQRRPIGLVMPHADAANRHVRPLTIRAERRQPQKGRLAIFELHVLQEHAEVAVGDRYVGPFSLRRRCDVDARRLK